MYSFTPQSRVPAFCKKSSKLVVCVFVHTENRTLVLEIFPSHWYFDSDYLLFTPTATHPAKFSIPHGSEAAAAAMHGARQAAPACPSPRTSRPTPAQGHAPPARNLCTIDAPPPAGLPIMPHTAYLTLTHTNGNAPAGQRASWLIGAVSDL